MQPRTVSPVFVGRVRERAVLAEALARAAEGHPQALLVGGEAGVGKSRLVEEFLGQARAAGALTAVGACVEIGADGLPFAPVSTVLRALHRQLGDELTRAAAGFAGELTRLLPELGAADAAPAPAAHEQDRGRLFALTARLLESLTAERRLVIAIEDLHWSDRSTRELLGYLFRSLQRGRVLLVSTFRSDDIHRRHPLRPFLAELDRLRAVRRLELPRFTRDEVRDQVAGILGAEPTQPLVDEVFRRSDGNAFFVEELACRMSDGRSVAMISESVRDLLLVRVEALSEAAQRLVRIVAEGGTRVEHELLRAVVGLDEDALIEALRAAVGANILQAEEDDGYRFRHALVREAVDDDLLPGERARISRRYAEALEADPALVRRAEERSARLASFWYHARDAAKALPAVLAASGEARGRYAYAEQFQLLERALELWDDAPADVRIALRPARDAESYPLCDCDDEALVHLDLLAEMVLAARYAGEPERGLSVANRALRALDDLGHPVRAAWFWAQKAKLVRQVARGNGWPELGTAQRLLSDFPPCPVHARVLTEAAGWGSIFAPGPDSLALAERAVRLARRMGDEDAELHALISRGGLFAETGNAEAALCDLQTVRERVVRGRLVRVVHRSHVNLPSVLETLGRSAEAVEVAAEGLDLAERYGSCDTASWILTNRADSLYSLGRWDEAEEATREARRVAQTPVSRALVAASQARLALARGDVAVAETEIRRMREHYGRYGDSAQHAHPAAQWRIGLAALQGRILDARELLAEALAAGFPPGAGRYTWPMLDAAALAESGARGVPAAEPGSAEAIARIRDHAATLPRWYAVWAGYAALVEAELRRAEGTATAADWSAAADAFAGLERPFELARIRARWAETLIAEADRRRAAELLGQAHATAEALGAGPLLAEIERLAQRARVALAGESCPDAGAGQRRDAFGLTPRERDVLALVAAGRSNRQIAEELFISPKTASVHVSNILAKLDVAGRGEAAALAHRLGIIGGEARDAALTTGR